MMEMLYIGTHSTGKVIQVYREGNKYVYKAEFGEGAAKDLEVAKMLAMIESVPPSERKIRIDQEDERLNWKWKEKKQERR